MEKRFTVVSVKDYRKDFCIHMGYELASQQDDNYFFKVPVDQVCRLYINAERWKKGNFNREKFLKDEN